VVVSIFQSLYNVARLDKGTIVLINVLLLLLAVFSASTAVIMIKASTVHPVLLASFRLIIAAAALTPVFVRDLRRHRAVYSRAHLKASLLPGVILAVHLMSWIVGARMTPTANASLIVNLMPLAMPFFLVWLTGESLNRREVVATAVALVGVTVLAAGDLNLSPTYFAGDLICFGSMLFYALYLALGRRNRTFPSVWLYLVPLYAVGGLVSSCVALILTNPLQPYSQREIALILGLGLVPTVLGHSLLNRSMQHFRGQLVTLVNMSQFVFAGIMAFFLFSEVPAPTFFVASGLVVASVWIVVANYRFRVAG
jgi:drug/metabolite transporter (DMT)-like permease